MTEKRFTIEPIGIRECIVDNTNGEQLDTFDYTERLCELLNELHKENKELKQELKIYRKIASCSNCEYQNYDWFDDGDEFEICERGNNEQQIEYHICEDWREL